MKTDEHIGSHAHDGELEEPVESHVGCVADAADARGVYFGTVEVLHCAETDTPTDGVNID